MQGSGAWARDREESGGADETLDLPHNGAGSRRATSNCLELPLALYKSRWTKSAARGLTITDTSPLSPASPVRTLTVLRSQDSGWWAPILQQIW
ncbi:hypothetical protein M8818_006701 [Zalaria obscura]|uniref:Uncharacterized protein n=1 Tax=Zalaria obscura TaxID=2024903 RepID=A0ACC3S546_9PEZI